MNVIDNILLEWAYRCPDGIVDLNDPIKKLILDEILDEHNLLGEINVDPNKDNIEPSSVTDKDIDEIKKAFESIKEDYGKYITVFNLFDPQSIGTISEVLLSKLLEKKGIPTKHVGGKQELTDIIVNNHPISLKTSGSKNIISLGKGEINVSADLKVAKKLQDSGIKKISMSELKNSYPDLYEDVQKRLNEIIKKIVGSGQLFVWIEKISKNIEGKNIITSVIIHTIKLTTEELQNTLTNSFVYSTPASGWGIMTADNKIIIGADAKGKNLNIHPNFVRQYSKDNTIQIDLIKEIPSIEKLDISDNMLKALDSVYNDLFPTTKNIDEGLRLSPNKDKIIVNSHNSEDDLLFLNLKEATIGGVSVYYSMEYNQKNPNAEDIKQLSDNLKKLEIVNKEELYTILKNDLEKIFNLNYQPKTVYYLDSSAPLSKMIGEVIKENFSDIEVLPLFKVKFPSWKDMLIPNYETEVKSPDFLLRIEKAAQKMWEENEGKIKSSGLDPRIRDYFKPKYDLDKVIENKHMMFIDDNVQTGTDFKTISNKFLNNPSILFYTAIRLNRISSTSTQASRNAKTSKIPFEFKPDDLKKLSNNIGVRSTYSNIEKLISKGYVTKKAFKIGGITYYLFANTDLTLDDLLKKAE